MKRTVIAIVVGIFVILSASMPLDESKEELLSRTKEIFDSRLPIEVPRAVTGDAPREGAAVPIPAAISTIGSLRGVSPAADWLSQKLANWAKRSSWVVESNGRTYKILGNVRALRDNEFRPADGIVIEKRGTYVLFEVGQEIPMNAKFVAYDEVTKTLGVITGAVQVSLKDMGASSELAAQYHLKPIQSFEDLKLAFYHTERDDLSDITSVVNQLKNDPRVERVDLHILDRVARPR